MSGRGRALALALALPAWAALSGCDALLPARSEGETLYRRLCADCHGIDGAGNTARYMGNPAADLLDDYWRHGGGDPTSLEWVIREGVFAKMPANQDLTDEQVEALIRHLRVLRGEARE